MAIKFYFPYGCLALGIHNLALCLVTSCCGRQTAWWRRACFYLGWGSMSIGDPSKSHWGGSEVKKRVMNGTIEGVNWTKGLRIDGYVSPLHKTHTILHFNEYFNEYITIGTSYNGLKGMKRSNEYEAFIITIWAVIFFEDQLI